MTFHAIVTPGPILKLVVSQAILLGAPVIRMKYVDAADAEAAIRPNRPAARTARKTWRITRGTVGFRQGGHVGPPAAAPVHAGRADCKVLPPRATNAFAARGFATARGNGPAGRTAPRAAS